jgi:Cft2 family RNA processing exonuclease
MKLTFLGGADEVGASCTLVEMAGKKILVDAGIRISPRTSRGIQNDQLPDLQPISEAGGPDYILVTHAHTDHTGALPLVMEQYPHTPVIMTRPTEALVGTLQRDAQKIMKGNYAAEGELPLFDEISMNRLMDAIQTVEFKQPVKLGEELQATYHIAGHIAGAAMIVLESSEGTLVMSGDVSLSAQRTVESVQVPNIKADALVLESTYGGKLHANRVAEEKRLIQTLKDVTERGGKVLIPAFALGRSQEIIQIIHAFRDQLEDVPVYVDGMVRVVCDSYARFSDLVPKQSTRMAGDDHLFFRDKVYPIRSTKQREEVARGVEPIIVVASSGMLTGGASVAYAKAFAGDERNAILLTGYQDEEAPGRFLQRIQREKQRGETPVMRLGHDRVKVRCRLGTYSLSAHADESELISVAEAFSAEEVMLVHGEEGPRHSLATGLRQRERIVTTPRIGTTRSFEFKSRPWAIGADVGKGRHTGEVQLRDLWESLESHAGDYFSAREIAQVWWGDGDRADEMQERLNQQDNIYFSPDWRDKSTFQIRTKAQVERAAKQRLVMLHYPDLVGKFIVLRNSNNQPRLGVVYAADIDSFDVTVQGARGTHYPADALLWVIGDWDGVEDDDGEKKQQMAEVLKTARGHMDGLVSFATRKQLAEDEVVVQPESLLPDELPPELDYQTALISVVLALAKDGAELVIEPEKGLKTERAREGEPLGQNEARELALSLFPPEARLRKVGYDVHRQRLKLAFDFPQAAERLYDEQLEDLIEMSGWDVQLRPQVNQQALGIVLDEQLPAGAEIVGNPSYYLDRSEVQVTVKGLDDEQYRAMRQEFRKHTNFDLKIERHKPVRMPEPEDITPVAEGQQMEINQAYTLIRGALEPKGLYKAGLKSGKIVLTFIAPQVGERHMETIKKLSKLTGYTITIHPHPNQQKIMDIVRRLAHAVGWTITDGPGLHTASARVSLSIADAPNPAIAEQVTKELHEQTGYTLDLS